MNSQRSTSRQRRRRRILVRGLIVLAILALAAGGARIWLARTLPRIAAAQIHRMTNTRARMGAFDLHRDGSISIDGLVVRPDREPPAYDDAILSATNVRVRFSLRSLLTLAPRLTEIRIEDFMLDVQSDLDTGRWNVQDVRFKTSGRGSGGILPTIILQQGKLRCSKVSDGRLEVVMSVPVEGDWQFRQEPRRGYHFEVHTANLSGGRGRSRIIGCWRRGELTIAGGLSSTDIPSLGRAWAVDTLAAQLTYDSNDDYVLDLRVKDAHSKYSPEVDALRSLVPATAGQPNPLSGAQWFFGRYGPCGTVAELTLNARGNFKRLPQSEIAGVLQCADVSVCDRRFPYAIDHLTGQVRFTQSSVALDRLAGKHGQVDLIIDGSARGFGKDRIYQYRVTSDNMILDESLYAALNEKEKRAWDAFEPTGMIGVEYRITRTSPTDRTSSVSVDLRQVAATYERFPYPLKGLTGKLYFDSESVIATGLRSQIQSGHIELNGQVTRHSSRNPIYYVSVDGNAVPLDDVLASALPQEYRNLYEQFDANGTADIRAKVFTVGDGNDVESIGFAADVSAEMRSFKAQRLPVALTDVSAEASITPRSLTVKKLTARYAGNPVTVTGDVHLGVGDRRGRTRLEVGAKNIVPDAETMILLPEPLHRHVAALNPQGAVNLALDVALSDRNETPDYTAVVECLGNSIRHERFAYPLHDIHGKIVVRPDRVTFDGVQARPEAREGDRQSAIRIDGHLNLAGKDPNLGAFTATARNIPLTDELGNVLPAGFAKMYRGMGPTGAFDLDIRIPRIPRLAPDDVRIDVTGRATIRDCDMKISGAPADLCGSLDLDGAYSTKAGISTGHMLLDAERLTVRGKPITDLRADIRFDPNSRCWSTRDFLGDCCGGRVLGSLEVSADGRTDAQYLLHAAFDRVDVQQFLLSGTMGPIAETERTGGMMNASLSLGARIDDDVSRVGACKVDITDMRVGRVSLLANLISVLQLGEPTEYTFDRMLIDSYLRRDTLLIQKLDMSGRNMAFVGAGTVDVSSSRMNLTLTARGRRGATAEPTILQSLAEGLGGAVVRMEITGSTSDPRIDTKALPLFEDSLRVLGAPR